MQYDIEKLQANIARADNDDLLDRITAYRAGMEPEAIDCIERELNRRGINAAKIAEHREQCERTCVYYANGPAKMCSLCRSPAIKEGWGWYKLRGKIPIFPHWQQVCAKHAAQL